MPTKVEGWKDETYGNEVRERIYEFAEEGWESIPDDEHDAWFERFKWWGLYHQRKGQESYFMMRIGTPNGVLEPGQLEVVADVADEFARGPVDNPEFGGAVCDWTTRQSIQLHWIKLEDIPEIWDRLESVGLSTQQACGDSWRNIVGCPVAGKDKEEFIDAWPVAEQLNETFKGNDEYANLPRKWKVSVTGCSEGCGQGDINDLAFEPAVKLIDGEETKGFNIRVGGGLSRKEPRLARSIDVFVTPEETADIAAACSALFREHGDREDRFNARIKFLVDEWGTEKFRRVLDEEFVDGELRTAGEDLRDEYTYNAGHSHDEDGHADHVGVHEQPDGNYYVGLSVLVGRMAADEVRELAHLADEYGSGEVRLTQRQNIIVTDVDSDRLDAFLDEDLLEYHSPEPGVFMRGSIACTGTEYCSLSIVETKNRMVRYGRWMQDNIDVPEGMTDFHTHLSGCTASCAQPQIADISLRGMKTRKDGEPVEAFDIGLGGGLGENPQFASWVEMRVAADEVPGYIRNLIEFFADAREDGESFREFIARHETETLTGLVEPEETSYTDPFMHNTKMTWYPYAEADDMDASPAPTNDQGDPLPSDD
ncbi:ferredoxin--nitrite reductase [Halobacteriales archaeon QH_7_65_31]|nr:MAG: ferredoxin--nitrite reductase [Halobacteriales archaeon QH_7_65_31]